MNLNLVAHRSFSRRIKCSCAPLPAELSVTVDTVTQPEASVVPVAEILAEAWPGTTLCGEPQLITGGFWASLQRIRVSGQPTGVPADLVVRVAPDGPMCAKELAVQRAVAELGFNTPAVRLDGTTNGHRWSVMDFAAGSPPFTGLNGLAALRRAPMVLHQIPGQLATPLAELHQLDPTTVTEAVRNAAPSVVWTVEDLLAHFKSQAELLGRSQLVAIVGRLAESRPPEGRRVVCHGDYHPFNLLVTPGSPTVVVDWTGSLLAEPVYDLAFTTLLLEHPPLDSPGPFGTIVGCLGRRLATRFLDAYQSAGLRADLAQLRWYRALHGLRVLIELASMEHHHPDRVSGHPFKTLRLAAEAAVVDEIGPIGGVLR